MLMVAVIVLAAALLPAPAAGQATPSWGQLQRWSQLPLAQLEAAAPQLPAPAAQPRSQPSVPPRSAKDGIQAAITAEACRLGLDPNVALGLAKWESNGFDPNALSSTGAEGIFQVEPATARAAGYDPKRLFEPNYNITAGEHIFAGLLRRYHGRLAPALAAFYAGDSIFVRAAPARLQAEVMAYVRNVYSTIQAFHARC